MTETTLLAVARRASALGLAVIALTLTSTAHATIDPLCGTTITSDLTLTHDVDCVSYTGNAITIGADNVVLDGAGFKILAPDASAAIYANNRSNVTIKNVDVSGWCNGAGIYLQTSTNAVIEDVRADGRDYGVRLTQSTTPTVTRLASDGAGLRALALETVTGVPTLSGLVLENALVGLFLQSSSSTWTLNPAAISSLAGSLTGIQLDTVSNLTLSGLTLDNPSHAINAFSATNASLTFTALDLSGRGSASNTIGGYGIYLSGSNHQITNVTANDRIYGVWAQTFTNLAINGLTAYRSSDGGLVLFGATLGPANTLSLAGLQLRDSTRGLAVTNIIGDAAAPFAITPAIGNLTGNRTALSIAGSRYLDVSGWTPATLSGITNGIYASDTNNQYLRFTNLDLSGDASPSTGLDGNYGMQLVGSNHLIQNVVANYRRRAVWIGNTTNANVSNVSATDVDSALHISNVAVSPTNSLTVANVSCTRCVAALDLNNVDGVAGTPWVIDDSVVTGATDVGTAIRMAGGSSHLLVRGTAGSPWVLNGLVNGVDANDGNSSFLTFEYLDLSGPGYGFGMTLRGSNHTVRNVVANDRAFGLYGPNTPNLTIHTFTADHNSQTGIQLETMTGAPPTLSALALTNNAAGFTLAAGFGPSSPLTLGPTTFASLAGNYTAIRLAGGGINNIKIQGLTLPNPRGIAVESVNGLITLEDLDLTGVGYGYGVYAAFTPNIVARNVTASNRLVGFHGRRTSNLTLDRFTARDCNVGVQLYELLAGETGPSLNEVVVQRNDVGISLNQSNFTLGPALPSGMATALDVTGSRIGIDLLGGTNVTLRNLRLNAVTAGISADTRGTIDVLVQGVDASGDGQGSGIRLGGAGVRIVDCIASDRREGVVLDRLNGGEVTNLVALRTQTGLSLVSSLSASAAGPTLAGIDVRHSGTGLLITSFNGLPWTLDNATVALNVANTLTGLSVSGSNNLTLDGFVLPSREVGIRIDGSATNNTVRNTDLSGTGLGQGAVLRGTNLTLQNVTADNRTTGADARSVNGLTVAGFTARHVTTGLMVGTTSGTTTLSNLVLEDAAPGLNISSHSGALALDSGEITSLANTYPAITLSTSPNVTVDNAGLGLTGPTSGSWYLAAAPSNAGPEAALCGTTLVSSVTLTGNLDCSAITTTALTLGAGVTLDGAGFDIIAPNAATVVNVSGAGSTLKDIDIAGSRGMGTGVTVGADTTVQNATVNRHNIGFDVAGASNSIITNVSATYATQYGMRIRNLVGQPLTVANASLTGSFEGLRFEGPGTDADPAGGDLVIDPASFSSLAGNTSSIVVANASDVIVEGLTLDGYSQGIQVAGGNDVVVRNLDVSHVRAVGSGVVMTGDSHTLANITVARRTYGGFLGGLSGWTVSNIVATQCDNGLHISGDLFAGAPTFSGLDLRDNAVGLGLSGATGPYTFTGAQFVYPVHWRRGNQIDIQVLHPSNGLQFDTIRLGGVSQGANVVSGSHSFSHVDVVAEARGSAGIQLAVGASLEDVSISGYYRGVYMSGNGLVADDLTIERALDGGGLSLNQPTAPTHNVSGLVVTNSSVAIAVYGNNDITTGMEITGALGAIPAPARVIVDALSGNDTDISISSGARNVNVRNITLSGYGAGIAANAYDAMHGLVVEDVISTPPAPGGNGVIMGGNGQRIDGFVAHYRVNGINIGTGIGHDLDDIVIEKASVNGVHIGGTAPTVAAPLTLDNIQVSRTGGGNNPAAIRINGSVIPAAAPVVLNPAHGIVLQNNLVDISLSNTRNVTVSDLTLRGVTTAIDAGASSNQSMTFTNLDLSGRYPVGRGLQLSGSGHSIDTVQASGREFGVIVETGTTNLTARNVTADRANDTGFFYRSAAPPAVLEHIRSRGSLRALRLLNVVGPATFSPTTLVTHDFSGSQIDLQLEGVTNATIEGFTFTGPNTGLNANNVGGTTFRNMTSTARSPGGNGFLVNGGANVTMTGLAARGRAQAFQLTNVPNIVVDGVTASGSNFAFQINGQTAPFTLRNLTLEDNHTGLLLTGVVGTPSSRLSLDGATMGAVSFRGTMRSVLMNGGSRFLDVSNLTTGGMTEGLTVEGDTTELGLSNFEVSRGGQANRLWCSYNNTSSTGAAIRGHGHVISDLVSVGRRSGVYFEGTSNVSITGGLVAASTFAGISIGGAPNFMNTTVATHVNNSATSFLLPTSTGLVVGRRIVVQLGTGPEERRIVSNSGNTITLDAALSAVPPVGTVVQSYELVAGLGRASVTDTDICANKSGATLGTIPMTLAGNHWRTQLGPVHSTNAGGTGDVVTGTATDVSAFEPIPFDIVNPYCNAEPVPDAGPDTDVCEGDVVVLDGTGTTDPDGDPLTFLWSLEDGQWVAITDADQPIATFTAPPPTDAPSEALTFRLTVDDNDALRSDEVVVTTHTRNTQPTAVADGPVGHIEGAHIELDGSGSSDPEGETLTYSWVQTGGPTVVLSGANTASPTFTAPMVGPSGDPYLMEVLTFQLTVTDGVPEDHCGAAEQATDEVTVEIYNVNQYPDADAGGNQSVDQNALVMLDGTGSSDPDGDTLTFSWQQTGGPSVVLTGADTATPTFTAPSVTSGFETLQFELYVSDGYEAYDFDSIEITVNATCTPTSSEDTTCDGIDDDCNGDVDEDYVADTSCFLQGVCAAANVASSCVDAVETACQTGTPGTEECNGLDDDCDGEADDGLGSIPSVNIEGACAENVQVCNGASGYVDSGANYVPVAETCDGIDNDCTNGVDDGLGPIPSVNIQGACSENVQVCDGANGYVDSGANYVPVAETCDGIDNDCTNGVDDGLGPIASSNVEGACAENIQVCDGINGYVDSGANYVPAAETCDGIDNDCTNGVDDGLGPIVSSNVEGACAENIQVCDGINGYVDSGANYVPAAETCDGIDNDCTNGVDNGLGPIASSNVEGACAENIQVCDGINGYVDSGANYVPAAETCDGIDNDCTNGVDDGLGPIVSSNVEGACAENIQVCDGINGYVDSGANYVPVAETCDGIDNDCTNGVDDGLGPIASTNVEGACAENTQVCDGINGYVDSGANYVPVAETCDGFDNDCANGVDDGLGPIASSNVEGACAENIQVCDGANGYVDSGANYVPVAETCDGIDNDCTNGVDDGLGPIASSNVEGACAENIQVCDGINGYVDSGANYVPVAETCDGIDNDCTNGVDDGLATIPSVNIQGACADNIQVCDGINGYVESNENYLPTAETCNSLDDDCNGTADDGIPDEQTDCVMAGGCAGLVTMSCIDGAFVGSGECALAQSTLDFCNGIDDDCDDQTDEDFEVETVGCGVDACGVGQGLTTCEDGVAGTTCEPLWSNIPDTTCSAESGLQVIYIIVTDAVGAPIGSVRCYQDLDAPETPVACDTQPDSNELVVRPELLCEGANP